MKLVSINIETNRHKERVLDFLKKETPDIVCLQELLGDDFDFYKQQLGFSGIYQPLTAITASDFNDLAGKKHGIAIFAKSFAASGIEFFAKDWALVWADVKNENGEILKIITTHLPVTERGQVTSEQLETIQALLKKIEIWPELILCGDTNAPRGREAFEIIARKYKDNIPAHYDTSIDQNLHKVKGIQFMVDGLFTTPRYQASNVKLVDGVSDHMAIVAEIS